MQHKIPLATSAEHSKRLSEYIDSKFNQCVSSSIAKTSYWEHHSSQLTTEIDSGGRVKVSGISGFYIPQPSSLLARYLRKVLKGIRQPSLLGKALLRHLNNRFGVPRLMSFNQAFDAAMRHDEISDPDLSPWRINHLALVDKPKVFPTSAAVRKHYEAWSSLAADPNIVNHYYDQNLLRAFISGTELRTVLEIGPGNGNFPSILYHDWSPIRVILIDLPETISVAFSFLTHLFPEAIFVLPNEAENGLPAHFDFAFLTVDQLSLVESDSVDLAINCHSFQEMTHAQLDIYYAFVQRVCRNLGYFFSSNRIEKIPCGPDSYIREQVEPPNRFADYPWNQDNEILIYEISRLLRLVQLDNVAIRLERIRK